MPDTRLVLASGKNYSAWPSGLGVYAWPLVGLLMCSWVSGLCWEVGLALLNREPHQGSSCQASPVLFISSSKDLQPS